MAQYRQSGAERVRSQHDLPPATGDQIIIRIPHGLRHHHRTRLTGKGLRRLPAGAIALALALALALFVTLLAARGLSRYHLVLQVRSYGKNNESDQETHQSLLLKELKFGHGAGTIGGRDSRYWDRDDRRRDQDYNEEDTSEHSDVDRARHKLVQAEEGYSGGSGLYNEGGRAELDTYKEEYEESLKNDVQSTGDNGFGGQYDEDDAGINDVTGKLDRRYLVVTKKDAGSGKMDRSYPVPSSEKKSSSKRKPTYHKFSGSYCEMKFLNSTAQLVEPLENKKFSRFSLKYTDVEERPSGAENWEPRFAGHQTLQEREESFYVRDQRINCGFIKSPEGLPSTGFDLAEDDVKFMSSCHIVVSSCIFGNSDHLRSSFSKTITRESRKNVYFVMFLDENTLQTLLSEGQKMDGGGFIGLWKIVVVRNLPYTDMRRVGKIPKFLSHRLFPSARYSIWLDSKLRLQSDPYLILEYFLWRRGYEYAISNHYDRHCVWEEVMQNKKLNKFNHTIIDQQFQFYQSDGLKRFDPSDPNKLLPSYVLEGSFIVRAHTPMSNLFSCLWFNEVDRFTPRDQLSFSYTYLKLRRMNPGKPFHLNMFKDCERRSAAKLFHHRAEEKWNIS